MGREGKWGEAVEEGAFLRRGVRGGGGGGGEAYKGEKLPRKHPHWFTGALFSWRKPSACNKAEEWKGIASTHPNKLPT